MEWKQYELVYIMLETEVEQSIAGRFKILLINFF